MSIIKLEVSLPLDDGGFLRRQCPFCQREFKIVTSDAERQSLIQRQLQAYLLDEDIQTESDEEAAGSEGADVHCPYCHQTAPENSWWTQEQSAYLHVFVHNIVAEIMNEQFIRPMKRSFSGHGGGLISLKFEGEEMEYQEPWISPERNDMVEHELRCCGLRVKLEDGWAQGFCCYQCGFPYDGQVGDEWRAKRDPR